MALARDILSTPEHHAVERAVPIARPSAREAWTWKSIDVSPCRAREDEYGVAADGDQLPRTGHDRQHDRLRDDPNDLAHGVLPRPTARAHSGPERDREK